MDSTRNPVAGPTMGVIVSLWVCSIVGVRFLHHGFSHQSTTWLEVIYTHTAIDILFEDRKCHWMNESTICSLVAWDWHEQQRKFGTAFSRTDPTCMGGTVLLLQYYQQALSAEREGRYEAAMGMFRVCLSFPGCDEGDIRFHLGWCLEQREGPCSENSLEHYKIAATTAREADCRINSCFRAGWLLFHRRLIGEAIMMFDKAIGEGRESDCANEPYKHALYWKGICLEAEGRFLDAVDQHRLVQQHAPQLRWEAMYRELMLLASVGRFHDALEVCEQFLASDGTAGPAMKNLVASVKTEERALRECINHDYHPITTG